jgi:hypothetical protein
LLGTPSFLTFLPLFSYSLTPVKRETTHVLVAGTTCRHSRTTEQAGIADVAKEMGGKETVLTSAEEARNRWKPVPLLLPTSSTSKVFPQQDKGQPFP